MNNSMLTVLFMILYAPKYSLIDVPFEIDIARGYVD